jgi:hypothetical protein
MFLGRDGFIWWIGVVEDNQDPLVLGRAKVRIFGYHAPSSVQQQVKIPDTYVPSVGANQNIPAPTETGEMPTPDLPWAVTLMPANMPGTYGIPNLGDWVVGFFLDGEDAQEPCILGYLPGIPSTTLSPFAADRFSERVSTVRSFNTVANVLPNSFGVTGNAQKDRFRFEQPCLNTFEMVNDTSVGNPISLVQSSGPNLQLKYLNALLSLNAFVDDKKVEIANDYIMISHPTNITIKSKTISTTEENTLRSRSILPSTPLSIGNPLAGTSPIGKGNVYTVQPLVNIPGYTYYHPSREDSIGAVDTIELAKNVGLLMNTIFPPQPVKLNSIAALFPTPPPPIVSSGKGGGGGGGGCFLGETLVTMSDWTKKRIDQIKDGDFIFNKDRTQVNKVLFIERVPDKYMWKELYTPTGDYEPFATPNHPLFVNGEWVSIDNEVYPWLGKINSVKNPITCETQGELVYNLWVTGDGTYIVNGFGTTSIMMDGGIMRVAYQYGYLSQDHIMELMREFTTQGNMMTYGSYLFNKLFGYITYKPIVKVLANTIKSKKEFLPRKAMIFLMKVFGKTATLYNKLKG